MGHAANDSFDGPPSAPERRLRRNVPLLGVTALLNDTATEMSYWVLPYFITLLGAGPGWLGVIEGVAESAASLVRIISGHLTDRWARRKPMVVFGYLIANAAKPLLGFAANWRQVLALRAIDRGGKGFRSAPRDVMIAESTERRRLGAAFGLRQAMDSTGAILGPAIAFWLMLRTHQDARVVFWSAAVPGALAVTVAWGWLRETGSRRRSESSPPDMPPALLSPADFSTARATAPPARFYLLAAAVGLFGLANSSDMFLILRAQSLGIAPLKAPLLGLVFNAVFAALSFPFGGLSDRLNRKWLIAAGYAVFAAVYWSFGAIHAAKWVWPLFAVYGLYQALTAGVLSAWVADLVPPAARGRAFGWISALAGVTALIASLLAGWLWHARGATAPFEVAAMLALGAAGIIATV